MARINFLLVFAFAIISAFLCCGKPNSDSVKVTVIGELRKVSPFYLSVAFSSQIVKDGLIKDLASSRKFVTLAKELSPAILRVGGSCANFLTYDPSSKSGHGSEIRNTDLDDENDFSNFTMTAEDFQYLKEFANSASMTILFDLNQFYRTPENTWDFANALDIFKDSDGTFKWQLGNEPNSYYYNYKYNFTGKMDANDYLSLRKQLEKHFDNPEIIGPDVTNPRFPKLSDEDEAETSSSFGGGAMDFSNTYIAGFLWLDKLGLAAVKGIDLLARQTLYQKRYALINDIKVDFKPNPDYWLSVLYKRLVGTEVLDVATEGSPKTTRLYGHCQKPGSMSYKPGNVVIFGVNVDHSRSSRITFDKMSSDHSIQQYLLESPDNFIQSGDVMLNGKLLGMTSDEELPDLEPHLLSGQELEIPPLSFGFWVIVDARVQDCKTPKIL